MSGKATSSSTSKSELESDVSRLPIDMVESAGFSLFEYHTRTVPFQIRASARSCDTKMVS